MGLVGVAAEMNCVLEERTPRLVVYLHLDVCSSSTQFISAATPTNPTVVYLHLGVRSSSTQFISAATPTNPTVVYLHLGVRCGAS